MQRDRHLALLRRGEVRVRAVRGHRLAAARGWRRRRRDSRGRCRALASSAPTPKCAVARTPGAPAGAAPHAAVVARQGQAAARLLPGGDARLERLRCTDAGVRVTSAVGL